MKAELEFHDSTLDALSERDGDVVIRLRPAYVRVEENGAITGYTQDVDLRCVRARVVTFPKKIPVWISDATLRIGSRELAMLSLPSEHRSASLLIGVTAEGEDFAIEAAAVIAQDVGKRKFVEVIDEKA